MGGSGGGGNSGGGSSGAVSYPAYMEAAHSTWVTAVGALIVAGAAGDNPYTGITAYDPTTDLAANATAVGTFNSLVTALDPSSDWSAKWAIAQTKLETDVFDDTSIEAKVAAYSAQVLARLSNSILPVYQRGMQTVRSVMTSAFTIGEALLTADAQRDIDKYEADLRQSFENRKYELISHATDLMLQGMAQVIESAKGVAHYVIEANRIKLVSLQEEIDLNVKYDEQDALWDLELYKFGGNILASISGAASATKGQEVSKAKSVLGGALSGAAAGAAIGSVVPGIGTTIGAGAGALLGGLGGLL